MSPSDVSAATTATEGGQEAEQPGPQVITLAMALNAALADAMHADPSVLVFGEGVGQLGGVFRITDGLLKAFGESRCFDTPLAESGIVGRAVGMTMNGMRPVIEMQFDAFAYPACQQIVSHVAKMHNRTRGAVTLPLVIRIPYAGGIGGAEHHSDSSESYYARTPGPKVFTPAAVADGYRMLREAIDSDGPVMFLEPKKLYWSKDLVDLELLRAEHAAHTEHITSSEGRAAVARPGTDATLIAYGPSVPVALAAADAAAAEGRSLEVIDVRSIVPFDDETVCASVRKTGRAVVIAEAPGFASVSSEIVARVQERCFRYLAAPIRRAHPPHPRRRRRPPVGRLAMGEPKVFLPADLGEGLTEAELVNWLVSVGEEVRVDQPVAEVETARATVEVPSPYAGTVVELHGEPGQMLDVGKPLISVTPPGAEPAVEGIPVEASTTLGGAIEPSAAETHGEEQEAGSGNVLTGYGTTVGQGIARRTRAPRRPVAGTDGTEAVAGQISTAEKAADDLLLLRTRVPGKLGAVTSPLVRRMAQDQGIDLGGLHGSWADGLILRKDVEAGMPPHSQVEPAEAPRPVTGQAVQPAENRGDTDARTGLGISSRTPLRGARKAAAENMTRSRSEIPEATVWVDVDATALIRLRAELKKSHPDNTPGLLAFIARFAIAGLKKFPELNSRIVTAEDTAGRMTQEVLVFDGVNLGFAMQTDRGLMVPSVRSADKRSPRGLDAEIRRLTAVVRDGKATPAELGSGTFTLNNYGLLGVDGSAAIINHPEAGIPGVGRIIDRPWVVNGELAVRKITELTLTFDRRVCDGDTAAGFLRYVADAIENPGSVPADV